MKKGILFFLIVLLASILGTSLLGGSTASAEAFNQNRIIDDAIFDNANTMSAAQIDTFLNGFPSSCISTNNGFSAPDPTGYSPSNGYLYGGPVSAGRVIYDAAQAYGLNPQVILSTLQKEEGTVVGNGPYGCSALALSAVAGYACTDSDTASHTYTYTNGTDPGTLSTPLFYSRGTPVNSVTNTCVNSPLKAGFTEQVIRATWLLKFGEQRSKGNIGWAVIKGNWDNSDDPQTCYGGPMTQGTFQRCPSGASAYYDGYTTIDAVAVHMDDGATAALYWYTPHIGSNFFNIFTGWFGNAVGPGYAFVDAVNPPSQILPNDVVNARIRIRNVSGKTWYGDGNVPAGQHPMRLAMLSYGANPYGNPSDPNWLGTSNQIKMQETSVADGSIATFTFSYKGPLRQTDSYFGQFVPVTDGVGFMPYIGLSFTTSTPQPIYSYAVTASTGLTSNMPTAYTAPVSYTVKNTGNVVWFNDTAKPVGASATRLFTVNPYYHNSAFYDSATWLAPNQVGMSDSKVPPGASTTFTFNLKTPTTNNIYNESLGVILDGAVAYPDTSQMNFTITASDYRIAVISNNIPSTLMPGQKFSGKIILQNTGTATWYSDGNTPTNTHATRLMTAGYAGNPLTDKSDPNWLGTNNQIRMTTPSVAPGQNGEFDFNIVAPYGQVAYLNDFRFVLDGVYIVPVAIQKSMSTQSLSATYTQQPGGIHPSPIPLSKGQISNGKLIVRNTSSFVWYNDDTRPAQFRGGATRVVMANPYYRSSVFANAADPNWLGTNNQIKMTTPVVNPGENAEFNFTWKAPNQTGTYKERFTLVLDGYLLFPDIGMELVTVVE